MKQTGNTQTPVRSVYIERPIVRAKVENPYLDILGQEKLDPTPHIDLLASPVPLPIAEQVARMTAISRASRLSFMDQLAEDDFGDDIDDVTFDDDIGMPLAEMEYLSATLQKKIAVEKKRSSKPADALSGDILDAPTGESSDSLPTPSKDQ